MGTMSNKTLIDPSDEGPTNFRLGIINDAVVIIFNKPTKWLGFTPEEARALAHGLVHKAIEIEESHVKLIKK